MRFGPTGTQPSLQRSHIYLHQHHLQGKRLMLLDKSGENHGSLLYFCGKAPNHVQASTVTGHLIVCNCKYVEMILRAHYLIRDFFLSAQYIKVTHFTDTSFNVLWWPKNCCTVQASSCFSFFFYILAARSDDFSDTFVSDADVGLVIHIWRP